MGFSPKEIAGRKFGQLTAIERVGFAKKGGDSIWLCKCTCGNFTKVKIGNLTSGNTKSCGCLLKKTLRERPSNKHPLWKGSDVGYFQAHTWLRKNKPKPKFCERCGEKPAYHLSFNGKGMEWSRNPDDYEWLCVSCHWRKDYDIRALGKLK